MRTNIDIDDKLMHQALEVSSGKTKKAAVEEALQLYVNIKSQSNFRESRGSIAWRGHDDDWFASDEQILAKRNELEAGRTADLSTSAKDAPSEKIQLVGEPRHR